MKTILVDDMLLDLQLFELKCADMPDFEIVGKFTDPNAAIEYAAGHVVDFALLDIAADRLFDILEVTIFFQYRLQRRIIY